MYTAYHPSPSACHPPTYHVPPTYHLPLTTHRSPRQALFLRHSDFLGALGALSRSWPGAVSVDWAGPFYVYYLLVAAYALLLMADYSLLTLAAFSIRLIPSLQPTVTYLHLLSRRSLISPQRVGVCYREAALSDRVPTRGVPLHGIPMGSPVEFAPGEVVLIPLHGLADSSHAPTDPTNAFPWPTRVPYIPPRMQIRSSRMHVAKQG